MVFLLALAFGLVKICGCYSLLVCCLKIFHFVENHLHDTNAFRCQSHHTMKSYVNHSLFSSLLFSYLSYCSHYHPLWIYVSFFLPFSIFTHYHILLNPLSLYQTSMTPFFSYLVTFWFMSNFNSDYCIRLLFNVWWACPTIKLIIYMIRTFWKALSDWTVNSVAILS